MDSKYDRLFNAVNLILVLLFTLTVLYPLVFVLSSSLSSAQAVMSGRVWLWPVEPTLRGYEAVFENRRVLTGFANTLFYTGAGTFLNVVLTIMAGYALSRKELVGRNLLMMMLVFTMLFSAGLIPNYLLVKDLGMLNSRLAMIIPGAVSVFNVIIARTFFQVTIPGELLEAAQIDGCSDFKFFAKVVLALSAPIIAVLTLFYAVGHWNSYFAALIYLRDPNLHPLQLVLREVLIKNVVDESMMVNVKLAVERNALRQLLKYSLIVVSTMPILLVYPFIQRHFVKGVLIGSLKG